MQNNFNSASSGTTNSGQSTSAFFARPFLDPLESFHLFFIGAQSIGEQSISIHDICPSIFGPINALPSLMFAQAEATGSLVFARPFLD